VENQELISIESFVFVHHEIFSLRKGEIAMPLQIEAIELVWRGPVNYAHLTMLMENEKFLGLVTEKLEVLGYTAPRYVGILAVTETIEDLVVALNVVATKDGEQVRHTIHVKREDFEVSLQ
jgi:hypothetical protein